VLDYGVPLALVVALTALLAAASMFAHVEHVTSIYLIPVLAAAIRGGVAPAVVCALASAAAAAFFFYPPIYDFRVENTVQVVDLALFILVSAFTGHLAARVRRARMREQADMLREALIDSVSHELRTPLSTIVGAASVLAQSPEIAPNARLSPLVQGLREEADRLNEHIQNLLDASRISSEGIRPQPEWIDPGDVVNAAVDRKRRQLEGHELQVAVADDLPLVHVDATLVEKALGQLIENAAKYSPTGSLIEIRAEPAGRSVAIAVEDKGSGLSADERGRIWDRFYRGSRHTDSVAGSGLGLWIARAFMRACGGTIEASSAGVGQGATFTLKLPVQPYAGPAGGPDD
jgi:K+-sensing histidine kinase KdpD